MALFVSSLNAKVLSVKESKENESIKITATGELEQTPSKADKSAKMYADNKFHDLNKGSLLDWKVNYVYSRLQKVLY